MTSRGDTVDWYIIVPASPWGGRTAAFGPMPEDAAREMYARFTKQYADECPPKLLQVVEDYARHANERQR
jgi:hypothetical protein